MPNGKFVSYLRVSTARQGVSGLGLEAQRASVAGYLNGGDWTLVREVLEVESGKRNDRPALADALKLCRKAPSPPSSSTVLISPLPTNTDSHRVAATTVQEHMPGILIMVRSGLIRRELH